MPNKPVEGRNGVAVATPTGGGEGVVKRVGEPTAGHRTYEVHQRERVGESTEKIKPVQLVDDAYRRNPYPPLDTLRTHYPFYRDWLSNSYWVTRYNDVTSIFTDQANFEGRSKLWHLGLSGLGRDFSKEESLLAAEERVLDTAGASLCTRLVEQVGQQAAAQGHVDLALYFAGRLPLELLADELTIAEAAREEFYALYWRMQRGLSWQPELHRDGAAAARTLVEWFQPMLAERKTQAGDDYLTALLELPYEITAGDVVVTLLERDHETLHGALANLWHNLLTVPGAFAQVQNNRRLMKLAYLETLRHSAPVLSAYRFARHEVERFGKLIPQGARLILSAAAANRDPEIFANPDEFVVDRRDLCQREPRGHYRADGLATGIAFGLGRPSIYPAVPEDRPRSRYAQIRDLAVDASMQLADGLPGLRLADEAKPVLSALSVGEMHTCWLLPVQV